GEATVRLIVNGGGRAMILDRAGSAGASLASELGERAAFSEADVTDEAQVRATVERTVERFGVLNVTVNCAGVGIAMRTITRDGSHPLALFTKVVQVNLIGTFNVIRLAAAQMAKNTPTAEGERGVIVNTASVAAYDGPIGHPGFGGPRGRTDRPGGLLGVERRRRRDAAADRARSRFRRHPRGHHRAGYLRHADAGDGAGAGAAGARCADPVPVPPRPSERV